MNLSMIFINIIIIVIVITVIIIIIIIIRSTPPSRPNKVGLKCPSVCPQKVSLVSMKFGMYLEVDE